MYKPPLHIGKVIVFSLITGLGYWVLLEAYSALVLVINHTALSLFPLSALLFVYAVSQGTLACLLLIFARRHILQSVAGIWQVGLTYGIFLWIAGAAPMDLSDLAARYLGFLPVTIAGGSISEVVRQVGFDVLLATLSVYFARMSEVQQREATPHELS